jgi:4-hydroxy-tetrahydrodipicolinate reductase
MLKFPNPNLPRLTTLGLIGKGKFGQSIEKMALNHGIEVVSINRSSPPSAYLQLEKTQVWIDVALAQGMEERLFKAQQLGIPVVIGTTGIEPLIESWKKTLGEHSPGLLVSANFNPMVHLFYHLCESLYQKANSISPCQSHLKEIHHVHKKDAPSGTAAELRRRLQQLGDPNCIIESAREGDIKGTHILELTGPWDKWTIEHQSLSRESFANGALLAAQWMIHRKGFYQFQDLIQNLSWLHL